MRFQCADRFFETTNTTTYHTVHDTRLRIRVFSNGFGQIDTPANRTGDRNGSTGTVLDVYHSHSVRVAKHEHIRHTIGRGDFMLVVPSQRKIHGDHCQIASQTFFAFFVVFLGSEVVTTDGNSSTMCSFDRANLLDHHALDAPHPSNPNICPPDRPKSNPATQPSYCLSFAVGSHAEPRGA